MPPLRTNIKIEKENTLMYGIIDTTASPAPAIALKIAICFNNNTFMFIILTSFFIVIVPQVYRLRNI